MFTEKLFQRVKLAIIISLALILSGCAWSRLFFTKVEKPTFTYMSYELVEVSQSRALVNVVFSAHNPNDIGLKNMLVSYELFAESKQFMKGKDIDLELPPKSDTLVKVPAVIVYADLLPVLGSVTDRILSGQKTIPITINVVFSKKPANDQGEGRSLSFDMKTTRTMDIPLPQEKIKKGLDQLRDVIKNLDR